MHKIDTGDAAASEPSRPAQGTAKFFSNALKTILPDWFVNMLQNELVNLVVAAGLTPDKTDDTQVTQAINALQKTVNNPFLNYALFRDEKANGTDGGTFTAGAWQPRDLDNYGVIGPGSAINNIAGANIAANQITLPAGKYRVKSSVPAHGVDLHRAILYNITDASDEIIGTSENSDASVVQTRCFINGEFTIATSKVFEIRHRTNTTNAGDGFGAANSFGVVEVYTEIEIWKLD